MDTARDMTVRTDISGTSATIGIFGGTDEVREAAGAALVAAGGSWAAFSERLSSPERRVYQIRQRYTSGGMRFGGAAEREQVTRTARRARDAAKAAIRSAGFKVR